MYANDGEFWESSDRLRFIRDTARHERTAPWAVLLGVLARVAVVTPPNVVTPAFVGSRYGSLNTFVSFVGASSDGKGLAVGTARRLIPDDLGAVDTLPVSGEGLATLFAKREQIDGKDGEERRSELRCANTRALLDVPEVSTLGAAMGRSGSTLLGTLTSLWSGEAIGGQNVNELKRLRVFEYTYRIGLIVGTQPGNSDMLTREDTTGLPQRILWASTRDAEAPDRAPAAPAGTLGFDAARLAAIQPDVFTMNGLYQKGGYWKYLGEDGNPMYPLYVLTYPQTVAGEVDADAVNRLRGTRPAGMDGHSLFATIKTAGLLAILEQREGHELDVTEDDWQRAKYIVAKSCAVREACISEGRAVRRGKRRDALTDDLVAKGEAEELAAQEKAERYMQRVENQLRRHDKGREGIPGTKLKQMIAGLAEDVYPAIERMFEDGRLEKVGPTRDSTKSQLWALADGV